MGNWKKRRNWDQGNAVSLSVYLRQCSRIALFITDLKSQISNNFWLFSASNGRKWNPPITGFRPSINLDLSQSQKVKLVCRIAVSQLCDVVKVPTFTYHRLQRKPTAAVYNAMRSGVLTSISSRQRNAISGRLIRPKRTDLGPAVCSYRQTTATYAPASRTMTFIQSSRNVLRRWLTILVASITRC